MTMPAGDYGSQISALRRYRSSVERYMVALGRHLGLHATDVSALWSLMDFKAAGEVMSPGDLGQALALSGPATTAVIDRLERAGYVERRPSVTDGRRVEVHLADDFVTTPGETLLADFGNTLRSGLGDFTVAQLATFEAIIATLANQLDSDAERLQEQTRA